LFGMFFLGALYMQRVLGYGPIDVGLAFLPVALAIGTLSLGFSARLNTRFGPRATLIPGLGLIVAGLALFARVPVHADSLFRPVLVIGAGLAAAAAALAVGWLRPTPAVAEAGERAELENAEPAFSEAA